VSSEHERDLGRRRRHAGIVARADRT
jgi:hypothetical protein